MKKDVFSPLEHAFLRELRSMGLPHHHFLLAVSGGVDSMALLALCARVKGALECNFSVAYIHHGGESSYRAQAWDLVRTQAQEYGFNFKSNWSPDSPSSIPRLKNESELREYRYQQLFRFLNELDSSGALVLAHHQDDLLETRLLRLIRGVGSQGIVAMKAYQDHKCRPLLSFSRAELENYVQERNIPFVEDPSNQSVDPLRNWLRKEWLPQLEERCPGGLKVMSQSLENLSRTGEGGADLYKSCIKEGKIDLVLFIQLSLEEKKSVLVAYFRFLNLKNYSGNHILEILKRLDRPEKRHTFNLLKKSWHKDEAWLAAK